MPLCSESLAKPLQFDNAKQFEVLKCAISTNHSEKRNGQYVRELVNGIVCPAIIDCFQTNL